MKNRLTLISCHYTRDWEKTLTFIGTIWFPSPFVGVAIFSTSGYWAPTPWLSLQILSLSAMQKAADLEKVYPRRTWEVCVPILFGSENFRRGNVTENVKKAAELLNHVNGRHASSRKGTTK